MDTLAQANFILRYYQKWVHADDFKAPALCRCQITFFLHIEKASLALH